jgi:hypothetical protein
MESTENDQKTPSAGEVLINELAVETCLPANQNFETNKSEAELVNKQPYLVKEACDQEVVIVDSDCLPLCSSEAALFPNNYVATPVEEQKLPGDEFETGINTSDVPIAGEGNACLDVM